MSPTRSEPRARNNITSKEFIKELGIVRLPKQSIFINTPIVRLSFEAKLSSNKKAGLIYQYIETASLIGVTRTQYTNIKE